MARFVSVASIMAQARQRTDIVGSQNPPDTDLLNMCNQSFPRWYDLLIEGYGEDYYFTEYIFNTQTNQDNYPLPPDFYKMRFVDLGLSLNQEAWIPVQPYDEALRDAYGFGSPQFIPPNQPLRLSYNPVCPVLAQYASLFVVSADGIDGVTFSALAQGPYGNQVALAINAPSGAGSVHTVGLLVVLTPPAGSTNASLATFINNAANWTGTPLLSAAATTPNVNDTFATTIPPTLLTGTTQFDFVNGWERYLVSDLASQIMQRLDRDPTPFQAEMLKTEEDLRALIATRDVGSSPVAKDFESEGLTFAPWFPAWARGFAYRLQGGNMHLISLGYPV